MDDVRYLKGLWPLSCNTWAAAACRRRPRTPRPSIPSIRTCATTATPLSTRARGYSVSLSSPLSEFSSFPLPIPQFLLCQVSRIVSSSSSYINSIPTRPGPPSLVAGLAAQPFSHSLPTLATYSMFFCRSRSAVAVSPPR